MPGPDRLALAWAAQVLGGKTSGVFVLGDLWQGNTLWAAGQLTALLDWDSAGAGDPGVDLGSLRLDAALCYGPEMAVYVLAGWEVEAGRAAAPAARNRGAAGTAIASCRAAPMW